jgi:outer membrane lipoprotein-sorting protein
MNCAECRENLVACVEGLLDREESLQCQAHLETCAACRAEHAAISSLQRQLAARGPTTAEVSLVNPVMRRVQAMQTERERDTIMTKLFTRWGFGLGAAAGAAAIILIAFLVFPKAQATAAEVMTKGAQAVAKLTTIHLRGQLRTLPADNFSYINADCPFNTIEFWKQFDPDLKWRVEKPQRVVVMDGQSAVMLIKNSGLACKVPQSTTSAFDTDWLQQIANLSNTITNELNNAIARGWKMSLTNETGADGRAKDIVTIEAKSGLPDNDYIKNSFVNTADTRRVYVFDNQSERLESVKIYLHATSGEKLIFWLDQIDYNQPIDPGVWKLDLPTDVSWWQNEMQKLPDNDKYASMTAEQIARAFFEACSQENWIEAEKFLRESPVDHLLKQELGGLEIIQVGTAFTSQASLDQFVPYEIKLKNGYDKKLNLALRKDKPTGRWFVDGGW